MPRRPRASVPSALIKAFLPSASPKKPPRRRSPAAITKAVRAAGQPSKRSSSKTAAVRRTTPRKKAATSALGATPSVPKTKVAPLPISLGKGRWCQQRFSGFQGSRAYRVYIPHGLRRTTKAPLLLALHGCTQDPQDFAAGTRFNQLADRHKFIVVYPEQGVTHNGQRCWNWFRPAHQFRAQGEPAILAGIVRRVIQETSQWRIDPERVYVAGISAGGAMSVVLAATYPELFAAVGVHSAPPYRSALSPTQALTAMQGRSIQIPIEVTAVAAMPPMIVFQGTGDLTVRAVNSELLAEQWLAYRRNGARGTESEGAMTARISTTKPTVPESARSRRGYQVSRWTVRGQRILEVWLVDGLDHAWSGGSTAGSYSDPRGPRASTEMWRFFSRHRLRGSSAGFGLGR